MIVKNKYKYLQNFGVQNAYEVQYKIRIHEEKD